MKLAALIGACLLAAGCAHSSVNAGSSNAAASVSVHAHGGNGLAALVAAGMLLIAVRGEQDRPAPYPPAMDESRRVSEQDCARPIDESAGNLRCR